MVQCRLWDQWHRWLAEIRELGYETRVLAFNSMHARPRFTLAAPQSRDRLYVAYWLSSLGRRPDWDKWLRPRAYCPSRGEVVDAVQVFKRPGVDMGRYRQQYVYRCPRVSCCHRTVDPEALPPAAAIGPSRWRTRRSLRIKAGLERYAVPVTVPAGGTWRGEPCPVDRSTPTRTTRDTDGVATPPFLVPLRPDRPRTLRAEADPPGTRRRKLPGVGSRGSGFCSGEGHHG